MGKPRPSDYEGISGRAPQTGERGGGYFARLPVNSPQSGIEALGHPDRIAPCKPAATAHRLRCDFVDPPSFDAVPDEIG